MRVFRHWVLSLGCLGALFLAQPAWAQTATTTTVSPNPVSVVAGGPQQAITVSTQSGGGTSDPDSFVYTFIGFPAGITFNPPSQTTNRQFPGPTFPNLTFFVSAAAGTAPGTYNGSLQRTGCFFTSCQANSVFIPYTVIVQQTDISATFTQPTLNVCNGGPAVGNTVNLQPLNGYSGTPTLTFTGIPAGITVTPANPPANPMPPGQTVPFTVQAAGAALGPQTVTLNIFDRAQGINKDVSFTVNVVAPDFTPSVTPSTVSVAPGGSPSSVSASITTNGCLTGDVDVTARPPNGIVVVPGSATLVAPGYSPATFNISAAAGVPSGNYSVTFVFTPLAGGAPKSVVVNVFVQQTDIAATFGQPSITVCNRGPAVGNTIDLQPLNGYSGTPTLTFVSVPSGITVTPTNPVANPMPPGQSIPFTVQAAGAVVGPQQITLNVLDRAAGINKNVSFTVNVQEGDFTPAVSPANLTLTQGGSAQNVNASITPDSCFFDSVTVRAIVPDGFNVVPISATLTPPGYSAASFAISAGSGVLPGNYQVTFQFTPSGGGPSKSLVVNVTVGSQQDFAVNVAPPVVTVARGNTGSVTVSISGSNGFTDAVSVTMEPVPGVTFAPSSFFLGPGQSRTVDIIVSPTARLGRTSVTVTGSGAPGTRTAIFTLEIVDAAQPDFTITVTPPQISIESGQTGTVTVSAQGINGFTGPITVTAPSIPGVTFTPSTFTIVPGASQTVTITVAPNTPAGTQPVTFTATAAGVTGTRSATTSLTITAGPPPAPDFSLVITPSTVALTPGSSTTVTVSVVAINGFSGPVTVTSSVLRTAAEPGVTVTPSTFVLSPGQSQTVTITVDADARPGTITVTFSGTAAGVSGVRTAQLTVTILPAPDFTLTVTPSTLSVIPGGTTTFTVSATALNGLTAPITVTIPAIAGVTFTPSTFVIVPGTPRVVTVTVSPTAQLGTIPIVVSATAPGVIGTRTAPVQLTLTAAPDFSLAVAPSTVSLAPGQSASVSVSAAGINGFSGPITVTTPSISGLTIVPATFTLTAGASQTVTITAGANASAGQREVFFTGTAPGVGSRTVRLLVIVGLPLPVITSIDPPSTTTGVRSLVLRVTGLNFRPGATITSASSGVIVESSRILSPTTAEVVVSVRDDATPGRYRLRLTNPDGGSTEGEAALLVYSQSSLGAPLGVTAAAIVFPRPGTMVAADEAVYPRGLLATTGSGTITGEWRLNGITFDLFTATVAGGMPTEIRSHVPIPVRLAGAYSLELVIQTPQYAVSPSVLIVHTIDTASRLTLLGPRDGTILWTVGSSSAFRWSLVPGTSGYELEIFEDNPLLSKRIRLSDAEWIPSEAALREIGPGIHRWRVRPIFPGEVAGEPTEWQRIAIVPERVELVLSPATIDAGRGRALVRWNGGYPGVLYRVEVFEGSSTEPLLTALTPRQEYLLPPGVARSISGLSVRVTAIGPDGSIIGVSNVEPLPVSTSSKQTSRDVFFAQTQGQVQITTQTPAEGTTVTTDKPTIRGEWSGAAAPETVFLVIDTTDVTAVSSIAAGSITYESLLPLGEGPHTVKMSAGEATSTWTFNVQPATAQPATPLESTEPQAPAPPGATPAPAPATDPRGRQMNPIKTDWALTPIGTITVASGDSQNSAGLQFSSQGDLDNQKLFSKFAGDASFRHGFDDPQKTVQESRNWIARFGGRQTTFLGGTGTFEQQATVGYAVPEFLDQAQLLTLGLARGGALGKLATPAGLVSFYQSFDSLPGGVVAGNFSPVQDVRAYALEAPWDPARFLLRVIGLEVDEEPGLYSAGGKGKSFGLLGKYAVNPFLNLIFEGARGDFSPNFESSEAQKDGNAFRLGLSGNKGTFGYQVNLRRTDATFVNPANRGFTPGGVSDRQGGDISVTKVIGRTSIGFGLRHLQGGNTSGSTNPDSSENGANLSISASLGQRVNFSSSFNLTNDVADADDAHFLPETDRSIGGVQVNFNETLGRISFGQTIQYQQSTDEINPLQDSTVTGITLTANGALLTNFNLSATAAGTQMEGSETAGTTDQIVFSLQPSILLPRFAVSIQPVLSYSTSTNDLYDSESSTQTFSPVVMWAPKWIGELLSVQVSANWSRIENAGQPTIDIDPTFGANLSLRWGAKGQGVLGPSRTILPGATPIAAPEEGSSNPVEGTPAQTTGN